jgi:hypothetical protein
MEEELQRTVGAAMRSHEVHDKPRAPAPASRAAYALLQLGHDRLVCPLAPNKQKLACTHAACPALVPYGEAHLGLAFIGGHSWETCDHRAIVGEDWHARNCIQTLPAAAMS